MSVSSNLAVSYTIIAQVVSIKYQYALPSTPTNVEGLGGSIWYLIPTASTTMYLYPTDSMVGAKTFTSSDDNFAYGEDTGDNVHFVTSESGPSYKLKIWDRSAANGNNTPVTQVV